MIVNYLFRSKFWFLGVVLLRLLSINNLWGFGGVHGMTSETSDTSVKTPNERSSASGVFCDFESSCAWTWTEPQQNKAGFIVISLNETRKLAERANPHTFLGPDILPLGVTAGHFLFMSLTRNHKYTNFTVHVTSPWYEESGENCKLEADFFLKNLHGVQRPLKIVIEYKNSSNIWLDFRTQGRESNNRWNIQWSSVGPIKSEFRISIEVTFGSQRPAFVAIDNLRLADCITDVHTANGECPERRCDEDTKCIARDNICDITVDCKGAEDEEFCSEYPQGARCNFEKNDDCGWKTSDDGIMKWRVHHGHTNKEHTGPTVDHTFSNQSGYYMLSEKPMKGDMSDEGILDSPKFKAPPCYHRNVNSVYYQSCKLRLHYHKRGKNTGAHAMIELINPRRPESRKLVLHEISGDSGNKWVRYTGIIPETVDYDYKIRIVNIRGVRATGDLGIDDVSLSPECFHIGVSDDEIKKCPKPLPTTIGPDHPLFSSLPYIPPPGKTVYMMGTCGATGAKGPTEVMCRDFIKNKDPSDAHVTTPNSVVDGLQTWKVPHDGYFTIIAKGASGGSGVQTQKLRTRGAIARGVFYLKKGNILNILVGQQGKSACQKDMHKRTAMYCQKVLDPPEDFENVLESGVNRLLTFKNKTLPGGGGGGGGSSFVSLRDDEELIPLVVAGGGGGLAWLFNASFTALQHGRGYNESYEPINGLSISDGGEGAAGAGGGLAGKREKSNTAAYSLFKGGRGGAPCSSQQWPSYGGFGGGGGGCVSGGGGGGYSGGNAYSKADQHGEGGTSFVDLRNGMNRGINPADNYGNGFVFIIPAERRACGCQHLCVHLDEKFEESECLCTNDEELAQDGLTCVAKPQIWNFTSRIVTFISVLFIMFVGGLIAFGLCNYRNKKRQMHLIGSDSNGGPEVQLNHLRPFRSPAGGMVTEYNPNYEFAGNSCSLEDLKEVPREHLTLIKALGQGAFGEVYKGYLKSYAGDSVEMPVAVKTLPEMSNNQSELDFRMEALIMSKFNHPNIVHFIGVCFDKHPRFIVLELLSGGDLKSFLRESRPQPDRNSPLNMKDLLQCALDVAKGCEYLELNHFIHRDIAARNCLLTTKGPGRVVKIADFGMARDIYRNDYYKKGGKAMLPVKWMPPEALLDGIFISKTDVWSFGVVLWEIMSLGYMPYPGRNNQEVMTLVRNGGRLQAPKNCPAPVYRIMCQCWHPNADERPIFAIILERLGYCIQDSEVVASELPVFQRPPSTERDKTLMRPMEEEACLNRRGDDPQSPQSTDYLIPMSYSLSTVRSDIRSTPSLDSANDCYQMDRFIEEEGHLPRPPTWETSFSAEPPNIIAPRAPQPQIVAGAMAMVPPPKPPQTIIPGHSPPGAGVMIGRIPNGGRNIPTEDVLGASPLLLSPPRSPSPPTTLLPRHQESRERLLRPGDEHNHAATNGGPETALLPRSRVSSSARANHQHYHPHRYNNSGSSNNSSSANNSTSSSSSNSSSTASTLPLDPASLPCIPPPLQYVNVDVNKKPSPDYSQETPYTIVEKREHREISC